LNILAGNVLVDNVRNHSNTQIEIRVMEQSFLRHNRYLVHPNLYTFINAEAWFCNRTWTCCQY